MTNRVLYAAVILYRVELPGGRLTGVTAAYTIETWGTPRAFFGGGREESTCKVQGFPCTADGINLTFGR